MSRTVLVSAGAVLTALGCFLVADGAARKRREETARLRIAMLAQMAENAQRAFDSRRWNQTDLLQQQHAYTSAIAAAGAGNCSVCPGDCGRTVAEPIEVAVFGPLLYRGWCHWSLAGASLCKDNPHAKTDSFAGLCSEQMSRQHLLQISDGDMPDAAWSVQREVSDGATGVLEVIRTPSSAPLLYGLRDEWPLRVDFSGNYTALEFARESANGEWQLTPEQRNESAVQFGWQVLPDVSIGQNRIPGRLQIEQPPGKGPPRHVFRRYGRILRRVRTPEPDVMIVEVWPGNATRSEIASVGESLLNKMGRDGRGKKFGYQLKVNGTSKFPPPYCKKVVSERVHLIAPINNRNLIRLNIAHWSQEALYHLFVARVQDDELVGLMQHSVFDSWQGYGRNSEALLTVIDALAPRRVTMGPGICLRTVRVQVEPQHPMPTALVEMTAMIRRQLRVPAEILPKRQRERLKATVLLRWPGGSRSISNWRSLQATGAALGWDVLLPLSPESPHGVRMDRSLDQVLQSVASSHMFVAIHGAELTLGGLAVAAGAIVLEISVGGPYMKHLDFWYANYGFSANVHIMRWTLPLEHTVFNRTNTALEPGWAEAGLPTLRNFSQKDRVPLEKFKFYREHIKRLLSNTDLPMEGWRRALRKGRSLLEHQLRNAKPLPVTGVPPAPSRHPAWTRATAPA